MVNLHYGYLEVTFSLPPTLAKATGQLLEVNCRDGGVDLNPVTRVLATASQPQLGNSVFSQLRALKPPYLQLQFLRSRLIL